MAVRGTKANPLTPEPFGVYAWLMVVSMIAMGASIFLICKELHEYYGWNDDQLWKLSIWWMELK